MSLPSFKRARACFVAGQRWVHCCNTSRSAAAGIVGARGPIHVRIPPGDSKLRAVCDDCGYIAYKNPLNVCGCIATTADGRILLARRAIEPKRGFWGLPAGYMECKETLAEAAAREVMEETDTRVLPSSLALAAVYTVPHISQVHFWFTARIDESYAAPTATESAVERFFGSGVESLEVALFSPKDIPWDGLAFQSGARALQHYLKQQQQQHQQYLPGDGRIDVIDILV